MIKAVFFDVDGTLLPHRQRKNSTECANEFKKLKENGTQIFFPPAATLMKSTKCPWTISPLTAIFPSTDNFASMKILKSSLAIPLAPREPKSC